MLGTEAAKSYFTLDAESGHVTLKQSLISAPSAAFTLVARAYDAGQPPKYDITTFTLSMDENKNPPIISPLTYVTRINETHDIGESVKIRRYKILI